MEKELSREESIAFFRNMVAKKEGISEEEAGVMINPAVDTSLKLMDPLYNLHRVIVKMSNESEKEGYDAMRTAVAMLLSSLTPEARIKFLVDMLKFSDRIDTAHDEMAKELKEYLDKKRKK